MASTMEMLSAGIFLIANTIGLAVCVVAGGPIFGNLMSWVSGFNSGSANTISPSTIQFIPGFFFTMLLILELMFIIRLGYVVTSKTDYQGETEW